MDATNTTATAELAQLRQKITELQGEKALLLGRLGLMKVLSSCEGFHCYYFENVDNFSTLKLTFDYVNALYCDLFGVEKYSDYNSFKVSLSNRNKRKLRKK